MADTTFGVKVPEELKKQLEELQKDSGLRTGKDFMQSLVNSYVLEKTKEEMPEVAQDLKELQGLTQRINNIYLNLGYRIDNLLKTKDAEVEEQLRLKDKLILDMQSKNNELSDKVDVLTEAFNNSVNDKNELNQQVNQLTSMYNDNKALVEEYKGKNDMLLTQLKQFEKYPEEMESLKNELSTVQKSNVECESLITIKEQVITSLTERLNESTVSFDELKVQGIKDKEELKKQYDLDVKKAIEDISKSKDAEKREALLKLKEEHQDKIQSIQTEYSIKINEYQDKYKGLLGELEKVKATQKKEPNKKTTASS